MKLAVMSDVHGNCFALETALKDMQKAGYDRIVCNGDMIQSAPQPHETLQLLREMNCSMVMSDHRSSSAPPNQWILRTRRI